MWRSSFNKQLLLIVGFSLCPLTLVLANTASCQPPPPVLAVLSEGIPIIVCADGRTTVDGEIVERQHLLTLLEQEIEEHPNTPIRIAIEMSDDSSIVEQLMDFVSSAPEGSGTFMFSGDFWFGGLNN